MYLKDYMVDIPYETKKIVIRNEKRVELELERRYSKETQDTRVSRRTIGLVVPLFPGKMYPNENYFALVPNSVPEEIRDAFLRRCARRREIAALKKDPETTMRRVSAAIQYLKEEGRRISMEAKEQEQKMRLADAIAQYSAENGGAGEEKKEERKQQMSLADAIAQYSAENGGAGEEKKEEQKFWFITNEHELEYAMKVFSDLYSLMESYTVRNPKDELDEYKVAMFNRILEELKLTMPQHRILQQLELIRGPGEEEDGMTNSDVLMLLTWYKNCLAG